MSQKGFSILEVILAAAMFLLFAGGISQVVVGGLKGNRFGAEQTVATQFAAEGIEAVRSIKNRAYSNLSGSTTPGVAISGGVWTFSGTNNTFDKYTRTLKIRDVYRDVSGNIVATGGTLDTNSKKVISEVNYNFTASNPQVISLVTYLTNFMKSISSGLLLYSQGTTTPIVRTYDRSGNTFSSESNTIVGAVGRNFIVRTSPTKATEAVVGYVDASGVLQVMCYNGTTWTNEWSVTVGGTGTTRRFDIAYETNTGDVVVLYSRNVATTNELGYRTKLGSANCGTANWAVATNLDPVRTTGTVHWVKAAWDKRASSNLITAIWADSNSDLSAMVWSGSAWGNEPTAVSEASLEVVSAAQDVDDFDVEYESSSGDLMVVWANSAGANGTNGVRYRVCTGGTSSCTWGAVTTPATFIDDATNLDISANPNSDEIAFASIGNAGSDLQTGYWSGSAWTNRANVDTSTETPLAGTSLVSTGWLVNGASTRYVVVYTDNADTSLSWYTANGSAAPTAQTDFSTTPATGNPKKWISIETDPFNKEQLLTFITDVNSDLFAKRLSMNSSGVFTWTNADSSAALEASLPQATVSPFGFAYWRKQ